MTKSDDKRVPTLRFKGFTDEWEQRKLGDVAKIVGGGTPSTNISNYWNGNINWYSPTEIGNQIFVNSSKKKITELGLKESSAKLLPGKKTILFTSRAGIGDMAIMKTDGSTNQGFQSWIVKPDIIDIYFLYSLGSKLKRQALRKASGSTFLEISNSEVKKLSLYLPDFEEQTIIGKIIKLIDKLITLQQRKLKLLKLLKKAMLQTLFTNKSIPNLRFISFDKSWDIVKLKDVGKATGGTSIESEFTSIEGTHKVISIGSYKENHTYNDQGIRVNLNDKTKKRVLNKDDLTMILNDKTTSGRIIGSVLLIPVDNVFVYNQRTERIEPNHKKFSSKFLYQYLNSPNIRNKIVSNAQGNTQIYVNWSSISKIKYLMPQKKEQDKISKLLFILDFIINNQQLRIKKYERFKQFLLQNMFI
ncbi:MAG: restriction endonuclease subunit S [Mollicutes bacterium]|nr:restriction endonuclease subunit S [Mollicutes bacterium]